MRSSCSTGYQAPPVGIRSSTSGAPTTAVSNNNLLSIVSPSASQPPPASAVIVRKDKINQLARGGGIEGAPVHQGNSTYHSSQQLLASPIGYSSKAKQTSLSSPPNEKQPSSRRQLFKNPQTPSMNAESQQIITASHPVAASIISKSSPLRSQQKQQQQQQQLRTLDPQQQQQQLASKQLLQAANTSNNPSDKPPYAYQPVSPHKYLPTDMQLKNRQHNDVSDNSSGSCSRQSSEVASLLLAFNHSKSQYTEKGREHQRNSLSNNSNTNSKNTNNAASKYLNSNTNAKNSSQSSLQLCSQQPKAISPHPKSSSMLSEQQKQTVGTPQSYFISQQSQQQSHHSKSSHNLPQNNSISSNLSPSKLIQQQQTHGMSSLSYLQTQGTKSKSPSGVKKSNLQSPLTAKYNHNNNSNKALAATTTAASLVISQCCSHQQQQQSLLRKNNNIRSNPNKNSLVLPDHISQLTAATTTTGNNSQQPLLAAQNLLNSKVLKKSLQNILNGGGYLNLKDKSPQPVLTSGRSNREQKPEPKEAQLHQEQLANQSHHKHHSSARMMHPHSGGAHSRGLSASSSASLSSSCSSQFSKSFGTEGNLLAADQNAFQDNLECAENFAASSAGVEGDFLSGDLATTHMEKQVFMSFTESLRSSKEINQERIQQSLLNANSNMSNAHGFEENHNESTGNCVNHPSKKGKYILDESFSQSSHHQPQEQQQQQYYCSKCAIAFAGKGVKVVESDGAMKKNIISKFISYLQGVMSETLQAQLRVIEKDMLIIESSCSQLINSTHRLYDDYILLLNDFRNKDIQLLVDQEAALKSRYNAASNTIKSHLVDIHSMQKDVESNAKQIIGEITMEPFQLIMKQYQQQCDYYQQNAQHQTEEFHQLPFNTLTQSETLLNCFTNTFTHLHKSFIQTTNVAKTVQREGGEQQQRIVITNQNDRLQQQHQQQQQQTEQGSLSAFISNVKAPSNYVDNQHNNIESIPGCTETTDGQDDLACNESFLDAPKPWSDPVNQQGESPVRIVPKEPQSSSSQLSGSNTDMRGYNNNNNNNNNNTKIAATRTGMSGANAANDLIISFDNRDMFLQAVQKATNHKFATEESNHEQESEGVLAVAAADADADRVLSEQQWKDTAGSMTHNIEVRQESQEYADDDDEEGQEDSKHTAQFDEQSNEGPLLSISPQKVFKDEQDLSGFIEQQQQQQQEQLQSLQINSSKKQQQSMLCQNKLTNKLNYSSSKAINTQPVGAQLIKQNYIPGSNSSSNTVKRKHNYSTTLSDSMNTAASNALAMIMMNIDNAEQQQQSQYSSQRRLHTDPKQRNFHSLSGPKLLELCGVLSKQESKEQVPRGSSMSSGNVGNMLKAGQQYSNDKHGQKNEQEQQQSTLQHQHQTKFRKQMFDMVSEEIIDNSQGSPIAATVQLEQQEEQYSYNDGTRNQAKLLLLQQAQRGNQSRLNNENQQQLQSNSSKHLKHYHSQQQPTDIQLELNSNNKLNCYSAQSPLQDHNKDQQSRHYYTDSHLKSAKLQPQQPYAQSEQQGVYYQYSSNNSGKDTNTDESTRYPHTTMTHQYPRQNNTASALIPSTSPFSIQPNDVNVSEFPLGQRAKDLLLSIQLKNCYPNQTQFQSEGFNDSQEISQ